MKKVPKSGSLETNSAGARDALIIEKLPGYFLIAALVATFVFMFKILAPFLTVLFVAAVLVITFYPVYKKVLKAFKEWERLASLVTCLFVILVTVAPVTLFAILFAGEAVDTYEIVQQKVESGVFDKYLQWGDGSYFFQLKARIGSVIDLDKIDIKKNIVDLAQSLSTFLVSQTATFLKSISSMLFNSVLMLFAMFYFFKDGQRLVDRIGMMSPLPSVHEAELFNKIGAMVKAIMSGVFLTAVAQGVIGGIGYAIVGISNPVFWGVAIAFFSMVPMVGTTLVWIPTAIILAILGDYGSAIFIFLWGLLFVGSVDNFLRPYFIGGKAHTYPLLTFFVILGGIWTMGFKGIVVGPLVLMVLMSFLHIYEAEYSKVLKK